VLDPGEECDASAGLNGGCQGVGCVNCQLDYTANCASIFKSDCTGDGSRLTITWGPHLRYTVGDTTYECHSDPTCCPPQSPPSNSSYLAGSCPTTNSTFSNTHNISSACLHSATAEPPEYTVSCSCSVQGSTYKCISAQDGVSDVGVPVGGPELITAIPEPF
jgi:hypothetical protein